MISANKIENVSLVSDNKLVIEDLSVTIGGKTIIKGLNAVFENGKKYLLIGKNGSGKSTLLKVLSKQIEEYEGHINFLGNELRELSSQSLFEIIGIIPQQLEIFEDTIQNNIILGKAVDHIRLKQALRGAGLSEERLNEFVTENRDNFSGGEMHRIMLARMFYNPKQVYLLDEVTSGLEYSLAKSIESTIIENLNSTIIHISHRSDCSIMSKYDAIINMSTENKVKSKMP